MCLWLLPSLETIDMTVSFPGISSISVLSAAWSRAAESVQGRTEVWGLLEAAPWEKALKSWIFCVRNHIPWTVCKCSLQSSAAARQNYLNWDFMAQSVESLPHKHRHKSKCLFLRDSAPSGPRHPSCSLLQDSSWENIEKYLRIEFSELQEAQWVSSSRLLQ